MKRRFPVALALMVLGTGPAFAQNASQGIGKGEIKLGTIVDLSGPAASYGKALRNGLQLRFDELNEQGGIQGRKVKLVVEDSGYDPKKSVLAAQKLINQDKVFLLTSVLGTAPSLAAMPLQLEKNVISFLPVSAAREMYEPVNRLKFAFFATNYDQMRTAAPRLVKEQGLKKPCVIYQDDDFGQEVLRGSEAGLKLVNMELVEKTSYKRGATDFSSQVARMKAAGCDLVMMGTVIRETVGTIAEARKTGFNPVFVTSSAAYSDLIHKLGGKNMDGLYAIMTAQHPYLDDASPQVRAWANKYKDRFGDEPNTFAVYGYYGADAFARAALKAGPDLGTDSFIKAMDSIVIPRDIFGAPEASFTATKRLGSPYSRLSQIQDGKWKVVSDYVGFNGLKGVTQKDGSVKVVSEFFPE
ncbi:ABC transporter substrate-binding protein [Variovorax sp. KBW07]|uniref:ABC transporter substrate-binding protein n=1 Tax=Variovorax sp. KBW07 TaxID=2153358 RepID=UPI000F57B79C|nr:ABC transporter substrate-binding protein [Variovorax sp. KBW07]RQO61251.1 ABC transporter substrate-binding protein [Variovorax sp. KBW07]